MTRIPTLAQAALQAAERRKVMIATAESCTGGLIIAALTEIAGSSSVVDRGFVTYSNDAKMEMLGVYAATLASRGAVSEQTAIEMAAGALARSRAGVAVSVTGIAGPGGGSPEKPVGLVWFGLAATGLPTLAERRDFGAIGRERVRGETVEHALSMMIKFLSA